MLLSQSKFANIIGCSQQNVSKMVKKKILTLENKKIDKDKGLKQLKDFNLLDENDKLKKERTKKEDNDNVLQEQSLPFSGDVGYGTIADLTPEEREVYEAEQKQLLDQLKQKEEEAKDKNIDTDEVEDIMSLGTYASSKAHREKYMAKLAELDFKIKKGEYILQSDVEKTFFEAARTIRDSLLVLPNKMSLRVVGKTDIKIIENLLMEEIQNILENLSV